jgi:redox-sensitive bicupin YhaK (pirin superfamily)
MMADPIIEALLLARQHDVSGLPVERVLPSVARRMVGPFVFFDHFGPAQLAPGQGVDVRPHPHIGLATVTYLFAGELQHRDTLGSNQTIRPGGVNWMTAGRGIAHSERTPSALRPAGSLAHGLQLWVALPRAHEECEPGFAHHPTSTLPTLDDGGVTIRLLAGSAYGVTAPVNTLSPLFFAEASLPPEGSLALPAEHAERAVYVAAGAIWSGSQRIPAHQMVVFAPGHDVTVRAEEPARVALIGGEPLDGARHVWWNFVSSSRERIEQAKADWAQGRFGKIPGDDQEFIPLP